MLRPLCALACATTALAAGYVKREFETEYVKQIVKRQIPAQDLDENITLAAQRSLYWLDVDIGTPSQPFRLQLDTGSSNLWVPNSRVSECSQQGGCPGGSFAPGESSTYKVIEAGVFEIAYADGTGAQGDFFTDALTVGEAMLPTDLMVMGIANTLQDGAQLINDGQGLVGVGYQANIAGLQYLVTQTYAPPTLIQAMVINGDIDREAYSLYLNDQSNGKGTIIFGGVDPTKYTGELVALQTLPHDNGFSNYSDFQVALTGISIQDASGTRLLTDPNFSTPALLDSGTTMTYLPQSIFNKISSGFGVSESYVPCSYGNSETALIYHFGGQGGPSISVPLSAMLDLPDGSHYGDGSAACFLNVDVESEGSATLGDSFMRSGYFVYDLQNNVIAVAQVAPNVTNEAITAISSGTAIPGCTSTNTLLIDANAAATQVGPMETGSSQATGGAEGSPTFALGSAATATSTGGSGESQGAAVSLKVSASSLGMVAVVGMLML